ncbi:hypothetical protein [Jannaschia formosa]|uniref:hypothetical protein n=1 Tax=Jannaschia formosa TaxID=2259592 RepID=UPI000E1B5BB3|nr:hypothetical protein [Jannaschia formosa]TFL18106.1 hypothetical protein DR046_11735 [Jannaschia formosa]
MQDLLGALRPAEGCDSRQFDPGTPFADLPDPGAEALLEAARVKAVTDQLVADCTEIFHVRMRDVPIADKALRVESGLPRAGGHDPRRAGWADGSGMTKGGARVKGSRRSGQGCAATAQLPVPAARVRA